MFLNKKSARPSVKRLNATIKLDFGVSGNDLKSSSNVIRDGNRLFSPFRRRQLLLIAKPIQAIAVNGEISFIMTEAGLYSLNKLFMSELIEESAQSTASCTYRGDTLVSPEGLGTYYVEEEDARKVCDKSFSSMTVCADRVFGVQGKEVSYTAPGDKEGWEKGETVTLPTACQALVAVGDKVYALGNTCYTLCPDAEDVQFKFEVFAHNVGNVKASSVANYNGKAVFVSSNGLYQISQNKLTSIFAELNEAVDFDKCVAATFDGKYYLCCRSKNSSDEINDVTLILDLDREEITGVLDTGYESICTGSDRIYAIREGRFYWISQEISAGSYVKSKINLSTDSKKFLDRLTVKTYNDLELAIHSETETRLYKIKGKKSEQKVDLRDMGWNFTIEMSSNSGLNVENLTLEAHTCGEV